MADKNIKIKSGPSSDSDTLFPKTKAENVEGILTIEQGGTGGDTATEARENLQVYSIDEVDNEITLVKNDIPTYTSDLVNDGDGSSAFITVSQVDEKLTAGVHYQGHVATVEDLPSESTNGYFYYVEEKQEFYLFDGDHWDASGGFTDLSDYATKEDLEKIKEDLQDLVDEETLNSAISELEEKINEVKESIPSKLSELTNDIYTTLTTSEIDSICESIFGE